MQYLLLLDYPRRHPFCFPSSTPQIYKRETGLANELWEKLFKNNQEGTYVSQNRVFHDWLRQEKLIRFFLKTDVEEVTSEKRKILRIVTRNRRLNTSIAFLGKFFVDSSGSGILSELANICWRQKDSMLMKLYLLRAKQQLAVNKQLVVV